MTAGTGIVTLPLVFPIHNSENRDPFDCAPHPARATRPRPQSDQTACEAIRHARERRGAIMNEANADPAFEARRLKSAPGWYVRVAWAHGNATTFRLRVPTGSPALDRNQGARLGLPANPRLVQGPRRLTWPGRAISAPRRGRRARRLPHAMGAPAPGGTPAGGSPWASPVAGSPARSTAWGAARRR